MAGALPVWLTGLAWLSVVLAVACCVWTVADVARRPQSMTVMNVVWPIVMLFGSALWLAAYVWWGRAEPRGGGAADRHVPDGAARPGESAAPGQMDGMAMPEMKGMDMRMDAPGLAMPEMKDMAMPGMKSMSMPGMAGMDMRMDVGRSGRPHTMPVSVFVGTCHCGAGCSLADLLVEWLLFAVPAIAVVGGADWLFSDRIYAGWVLAFVVAYLFGIAFQYFSIAPMRGLGIKDGLKAAIRADTLSITAWQVGMYGTMAVVQLWLAPMWWDGRLAVDSPVFWLMMQLAMVVGFGTAYPVNWWLLKKGLKEPM